MNGEIRDGLIRVCGAAIAAVLGLVIRAADTSTDLLGERDNSGFWGKMGGLLLFFALVLFIWGMVNVMKGLGRGTSKTSVDSDSSEG